MPVKVTTLFHHTTTKQSGAPGRIGGWSESFILDQPLNALTAINAAYTPFLAARCALLAKNCGVVGYRYQEFEINGAFIQPGATQAFKWNQNGSTTRTNDFPNAALRMKARTSDSLQSRQITWNGIPDDVVYRGEYYNDQNYTNLIVAWAALIQGGGWKVLCINKANPLRRVIGYNDPLANKLTTDVAHGFADGDVVEAYRVTNKYGQPVKGRFKVIDTDATHFTLVSGPFTVDVPIKTGGKFRKIGYVLKGMQLPTEVTSNPTTTTRKVGAPFDKFVGRS